MRTVLTAARLWNGARLLDDVVIVVEEGRIARIASRSESDLPAASEWIDFEKGTLAPAFLDVHTHGCAGHDVMEATPEALDRIGGFLASRGTGSYLATTVTAPVEPTLRALEGLARRIGAPTPAGQARPLGIHLEGPFLSHVKRGVHPPADLKDPDVALFDRFFEAAEWQIRLMTLAPELPGAVELAAHATSRGVRVSMGHSNATAVETQALIAAGATSATHIFNAMRALDHREPGILGTVLTDDSIYGEIICDGIHTAREMVKLWWRAKGAERGLLVTDAMSAAGMPDGEYELGGFKVQVANGRATAGGVLAGSVLTLDKALSNCLEFTGADLTEALRLVTVNPARMTGLEELAGSVGVGDVANLVALDAGGRLTGVVMGGKRVG